MQFIRSALISLSLFSLLSGGVATAQLQSTKDSLPSRDLVLGRVIKSGLENYHFSKLKINDTLSERIFKLYIERLDYSKRYLLQSDVDALRKHLHTIDDEILSGDYSLMREGTEVRKKRIAEIEKFTDELLSKPFDLTQKDSLEIDPLKREFPKTMEELKEAWRKTLKLEILNRYMTAYNEQEGKDKKKDAKDSKEDNAAKKEKKKKDSKPKLSMKEMEAKSRESIKESYKRIFKRKILEEGHNEELSRFFNAVTMSFDPHTNYFAPKAKEDFDIEIRGSLEGIGAVLREDGDYITVVEVVPGSASWRQGNLKAEDTIVKVGQSKGEPTDIVGMPLEDAVRLIRGKKGSEVKLTVKKPDGKIQVIPIVRDTVIIEEAYVKSALITDKKNNKKIGYIYLPKFYRDFSKGFFDSSARNCTDDVRKAVQNFTKMKVDGMVLDLRMNGGGSLEDAVQMSGLFIKSGPIVQVKSSEDKISVLKDSDPNVVYNGPLQVMVNKFSASASEILAGALQDYERAVIVGAKNTHGKGTVQSIIDLDQAISSALVKEPLGSIKLTISKFYRVTGSSTQYKGVIPDIALPDPQDYIETGEQSLDFSLPWDEIKPVSFTKWEQRGVYDIKKLSEESKKRVAASEKFTRTNNLVTLLESKRKDTLVTLNVDERLKEDKEYEKKTEEFKNEKEADWYTVEYIPDEEAQAKIKKDPKYAKDLKKKEDEFAKKLRIDPQMEEVVNIFKDMETQSKAVANNSDKKTP